MLKLLSLGLMGLSIGAAQAESWEELCKTPEPTTLPEEAVFCRLKSVKAATATEAGSVQSECYGPGTNYSLGFATEVKQVTLRIALSPPVQVQSTTLNSFQITLPIDRRYLCHRMQRKAALGEVTVDRAAHVITDLIRLGTYVKPRGLMEANADAQTYVLQSVAAQLGRGLSDSELAGARVTSFRSRYPVRAPQTLAE